MQHSAVLLSIIGEGFTEMLEHPVISIIYDDLSPREAVSDIINAGALAAKAFESKEDLLVPKNLHRTSCLIADMPMSGMSRVELRHCVVTAAPLFRRCSLPPPRMAETRQVR